jgi:hypothetical protein
MTNRQSARRCNKQSAKNAGTRVRRQKRRSISTAADSSRTKVGGSMVLLHQ